MLLTLSVVCVCGIYLFITYLHYYYVHYPEVNFADWGAGNPQIVITARDMQSQYQHIVIDNNISFISEYTKFYAPSLHPVFVNQSWTKPKDWKNGTVLYIRPFYGQTSPEHLVKNLTIPNPNRDIYAQFLKL